MFRRAVYQYYTNVNYRTCEQCLSWHGVIRRRAEAFPQPVDACESSILRISRKDLRLYREKSKQMRLRAQGELRRRELFEEALNLLANQSDEALDLFGRPPGLAKYIPDIDRFSERHGRFLQEHSGVKDRLRTQLLKAYSDKFGWRRYELLPEVMRLQREQAGMDRINELLR